MGVITWNNRNRRSPAVLAACCLVALVTACAGSENTPPNGQSSAERATSVTTGSTATSVEAIDAPPGRPSRERDGGHRRWQGAVPRVPGRGFADDPPRSWRRIGPRGLVEGRSGARQGNPHLLVRSPGTGSSSEADGCRGIDEIVGDTETLIEAAELEAPFIFVGASGGGYLAAEMAVRHPTRRRGWYSWRRPRRSKTSRPTSHPCCRAMPRPTWSGATTWLSSMRCGTTSTRSASSP